MMAPSMFAVVLLAGLASTASAEAGAGAEAVSPGIPHGPTREQKGSASIYAAKPAARVDHSDAMLPGPGPNGLAKTPPMGWMSWEIFRCEVNCTTHPDACIDHNLYERMTDHIASDGYLEAGYNQVSIDDCWANKFSRDPQGRLFPDPARFPAGMKALGDYMHAKGVRFGTYGDEGKYTCGFYPGTKDHEKADADTFASWGVDYLKLDGCYEEQPDFAVDYPRMGSSLQATGRPIVYSCSWPAYLGDNETAKPFEAMIAAGCNLWRNWGDIDCNWQSVLEIVDHWGDFAEALQPWAGPGHWHDMDMLLVGANCLNLDEERTQMAIWSISASPLIMGNDLRKVPDASKAILLNRHAIAVNQDSLGRMGIRHRNFTSASTTQVWYRQLAGGDVAVALYNKAVPQAVDITVQFADVGLAAGKATVFDIWAEKALPQAYSGSYTAQAVPPHGSAFIRLSPASEELATLVV